MGGSLPPGRGYSIIAAAKAVSEAAEVEADRYREEKVGETFVSKSGEGPFSWSQASMGNISPEEAERRAREPLTMVWTCDDCKWAEISSPGGPPHVKTFSVEPPPAGWWRLQRQQGLTDAVPHPDLQNHLAVKIAEGVWDAACVHQRRFL